MKLFTAIVLFFFFSFLSALDSSRFVTQFVHDIWSDSNGLPQNSVQSIIQTRDSYIWIGTQEGLAKFDGVKFKILDKSTVKEFNTDQIQVLFEDSALNLWIGGYKTLLKQDRLGKISKIQIQGDVWKLAEDKSGNIFFGTMEDGLSILSKDGKITQLKQNGIMKSNVIQSLMLANDGSLWIGTAKGGYIYKNGLLTQFLPIGDKDISLIFEDKSGAIYFSADKSLFSFKNQSLTEIKDSIIKNIPFLCAVEDKNSNIWFGTRGMGLIRYKNKKFDKYSVEEGLTDSIVISLLEDKEGSLFIGTENGGLNRFRDGKFIFYSKTEGIPNESIRTIASDQKNSIFLGTDSGDVLEFTEGNFINITKKFSLKITDPITAVRKDSRGILWIGTRQSGLYKIENNKIVHFDEKNGLASSIVRVIYESPKGELFVGTKGSRLNRFNGKNFDFIELRSDMEEDFVKDIAEDSLGNLWIATVYHGIIKYNEKSSEFFDSKKGIKESFYSIYVGNYGTYAGTMGAGFLRIKDNKLCWINASIGLPNNTVFKMIKDSKNNLWMSSNKGIFTINEPDIESFCSGKSKEIKASLYGVADGMKSREFNGGTQPAGDISPDGKIYFPSVRGFLIVNPTDIKTNTTIPPVYIESLKADNHFFETDKTREITLSSGIEKLSFNFTALSYLVPEQMKFSYILEGFENKWNESEKLRSAYYTKIPPGTYNFKVRASNNDGVWNNKGASIKIIIPPRFYETGWFLGISIFSMFLAIYGVFRLRVVQIKRQNRILQKLVDERTREIKEMALKDTLTGLRNRRYFAEILKDEVLNFTSMKERESLGLQMRNVSSHVFYGVFLIDLDHFKLVNDNYGHDCGDMVLKQLSDIFQKCVRKDDIVMRWGGEEFLIVLKNTHENYIPELAEKIRKSVESYNFDIGKGETIKKTCSMGYTQYPFYEENPRLISFEECVKLTDMALYRAKETGRNRNIGFYPGAKSANHSDEILILLDSVEKALKAEYLTIVE